MSVKYNKQGVLWRLFRIGYWQANPICIWRSLFRFMEYVLKTRRAPSFARSDRYTLIPVEVNLRDLCCDLISLLLFGKPEFEVRCGIFLAYFKHLCMYVSMCVYVCTFLFIYFLRSYLLIYFICLHISSLSALSSTYLFYIVISYIFIHLLKTLLFIYL